jgi:hypothetical protein
MPTFVDYAGMNTLVSSSIDGNTISSGRNALYTEASIPVSQELVGINLHRNGPYGYSSWKQLRISENPVTRHHIANSTMTFVTEPGPMLEITAGLRVRSRYSALYNYKEPAIAQKSYPLVWNVGRHFKDEDGQLAPEPQKFSIVSSYGNQQIGFANEKVDKLLKFDPDEEQTEYVAIADMYLDNGLNKQDSPLTYWEFLQYRETVFPHMKNQFQKENLERPTFESFFRHIRADRTKVIRSQGLFGAPYTGTNILGTSKLSQSTWVMDEHQNFLTRTYSSVGNSIDYQTAKESGTTSHKFRMGQGVLMSTQTQFWFQTPSYNGPSGSNSLIRQTIQNAIAEYSRIMAPGPLYMRRTSLSTTASVSNPSGMHIDSTGSGHGTALEIKQYQGGALWETGPRRQIKDDTGTYINAPKTPFYDTYANYAEEMRRKYKNFSIVPEFRMSTQIEDYRRTNNAIELDMFDVTGGIEGTSNSFDDNFYEIYSNSDFMRNFEVIDDDHKDFTSGKVLSLRCKAVKKLLPYEGFYPAQRTADLTKRFYDSFKDHIKLVNESSEELNGFNYGRQMVLAPLFAPGVLFNTIKSGVAVDYPIITGSLNTSYQVTDITGSAIALISNSEFDKRIPFEAIVEPAKYLSNYKLVSNEPDLRANLSASAEWDGGGDELYSMMANNFLAESINFFLPNGELTSIVSKKQKDIRLKAGSVYGMRIKMRRSMTGSRGSVYHIGKTSFPYIPPQDIIRTGSNATRETFTMYSRPSAFGPPSRGNSVASSFNFRMFDDDPTRFVINSSALTSLKMDSRFGYNFPFTPPYYHGEAWCEIFLTASSDSMTIKEIQSSVTSSFSRFDSTFLTSNDSGFFNGGGPQSFMNNGINKNAVQLSASLNINGIGKTKPAVQRSKDQDLIVDSAGDLDNRWIIQTKFETPMLNFAHVSGSEQLSLPDYGAGSVPRGMWHQHGRVPEESEGVFLEVTPIPENYQEQVLGRPAYDPLGDLSEALGFAGSSTKIGRIASSKKIAECVVAVPFVEKEGGKKFFRLTLTEQQLQQFKEGDKQSLTSGPAQSQIGRSVLLQLDKMERFVFPPSFDFLRFPDVDPISMYVFEFTHTLSQQDLSDIWQNLPPDIGETMEVSEVAITHPLLQKELLGQGGEEGNQTIDMPERLKWMVFKVKQRAATNYFKKTVLRNPEINTDVNDSNVTKDEFGDTSPIQYNWPYDFFSLVELVKIDAEVELGNIDFTDYTDHLPKWDGVEADREKIANIVGGLEDDPIPEVEIPALPFAEATVTTEVFAGQNFLSDTAAVAGSATQQLAVGIDTSGATGQSDEERKQAMIAKRRTFMRQFRAAYRSASENVRGLNKRMKALNAANVTMGGGNSDGTRIEGKSVGYYTGTMSNTWSFIFGDGMWDDSLGLPQNLTYEGS